MSNDDAIRQHLNNIISDATAAKGLLAGGTGPGPEPEPEPEPETYELKTVGRTWKLEGVVKDWKDALVFPPMSGLAGFTAADIQLTFQVGQQFDGLRNLLYLTENAGRWKGDVVCLVNRGASGALALSNTLGGAETTPARAAFPLVAGQTVELRAWLQAGVWTVAAGPATVQMQTPALTSTSLKLQLGNSSSDGADHPVNAGWKVLRLTGSVS